VSCLEGFTDDLCHCLCCVHIMSMVKGKVIPLHAMEAHGVRGGISPAHS
jgi:hypothetical protein